MWTQHKNFLFPFLNLDMVLLDPTLENCANIWQIKVSVKENEVPIEKNSSRVSIFATKASYISN